MRYKSERKDRGRGWISGHVRPRRRWSASRKLGRLSLFGTLAAKNDADGPEQNLEVEEERPVLDIVEVDGAALGEGDVAPAGDLGETGKTGFDRQEETTVAVVAKLAWNEGAGTDEGDVATDDIEKLGEFVEGGAAEEGAELGDARVVLQIITVFAVFLNQFGLVHLNKSLFGGKAGKFGLHGAEFVNLEFVVVASETDFGVEGAVAGVGKFHQKENDGHNRQGKEGGEAAEEKIEETFNEAHGARKRGDLDEDGGDVADEFEVAKLGGEGGFARNEIVGEVVVQRLFIDIFGLTFVGLEDNVRVGLAQGVF